MALTNQPVAVAKLPQSDRIESFIHLQLPGNLSWRWIYNVGALTLLHFLGI